MLADSTSGQTREKIGLLFDGNTSDTEVSPEKADGSVCFVTYALDMGVPE